MFESNKLPAPLYEQIYGVVRQVPRGRVTTYGAVARIVGGCTARMVGYAMAATPEGSGVPWQRVINSQGKISPHGDGYGTTIQRQLLEEEGIPFDLEGKIDLAKYGWPEPPVKQGPHQASLFEE
jgi:methylated-DNA-protein-cysteine methyltransferase related protein